MESSPHWVNNFWGKDDAGYHLLVQRVQGAKQTCDELKHFYKERMAIEQEYAKKLNSLAHKALGSAETGDMKLSFETVRSTTKAAADTHETVARQINEQLLAPLTAFASSLKGRNKAVEDVMAQLTKAKSSQNSAVEKARSRYLNECNKISGFQAQQNLLLGKELDKNKQKLDRATYQVETYQRQYQDGLRALAQCIEAWNAEWRLACDKFEKLDEERLTFTKSSMWAFANAISAACVADDEGCESVRTSLEKVDPTRDLANFSREYGTGSQIQDPPEFVNFLQGFSRDNDSEDGRYHMANFDSALDEEAAASTGHNPHASSALGEIPDLHLSPNSSTRGSPQLSDQYTPMSSPGTTSMEYVKPSALAYPSATQPPVDQPPTAQSSIPTASSASNPLTFAQKKLHRRSWAMPFKRKSQADFSAKPVSALDQPTPSSSFQRLADPQITGSSTAGNSTVNSGARNRHSWAPASIQQTDAPPAESKDPLLAALERLKAPSSTTPTANASGKGPAPSLGSGRTVGTAEQTKPYSNGTQVSNGPPNAMQQPSPAQKKPVQRKQVASAPYGRPALPPLTSDGRRVIRHSIAQYDYRAAIPEEVSFRRGDLLLITEMQADGWWDCEVSTKHTFGLAPSNFLKDA